MADVEQILKRLKEGQTVTYKGELYQKRNGKFIAVNSRVESRSDEPRSESRPRNDSRLIGTDALPSQDPPPPGEPEIFGHRGTQSRTRPRGNPAELRNAKKEISEPLHRRNEQKGDFEDADTLSRVESVRDNRPDDSSKDVNTLSTSLEVVGLDAQNPRLPRTKTELQIVPARKADERRAARQRSGHITSVDNSEVHIRDRISDAMKGDVDDVEEGEEDDVKENDFKYLTGAAKAFALIPFADFDERAEYVVDNDELLESNLAIFLKEAVWQKCRGRLEMAKLCTQSLVLLRIWRDKKKRQIFKYTERLIDSDGPERDEYRKLYGDTEKGVNRGVAEKVNRGGTTTNLPSTQTEKGVKQAPVAATRKASDADQFNPRLVRSNVEKSQQNSFKPNPPLPYPDTNLQTLSLSHIDPRSRGAQLQPQGSYQSSHTNIGYSNSQNVRLRPRSGSNNDQQESEASLSRQDSHTGWSQPRENLRDPWVSGPDYIEQTLQLDGSQDIQDIEDQLNGLISMVGNKEASMQIIPPDKFAGEDAQKMRTLSALYKVPPNGKTFFEPGRVFAVLWSQPAGESHRPKAQKSLDSLEDPVPADKLPYNVTYGLHGQKIFSQIRRMVVIRNREGYCWCVSIGTYGGRGLKKKGLKPSEVDAHAIVHDSREEARYLQGEPSTIKRPIAVDMAPRQTLDIASRLHYAKPFSVEWNTNVMNVGMVSKRCMGALCTDVVRELFGDLPLRRE